MNHHAFTWTPGHPEQTFLLETTHLAGLLARLPCDVSYLPAPEPGTQRFSRASWAKISAASMDIRPMHR